MPGGASRYTAGCMRGLRLGMTTVLLVAALYGVWCWWGRWEAVRGVGPAPVATGQATGLAVSADAAPSAAPSPMQANGCVTVPAAAPAPPPPAALQGQLGLWVAVIDPVTLQPVRAVAYQPAQMFPLASSYKQAVLWALLRQVDAGRLSLNTTYNVTVQAQSLGDYPYDHSTARTLAERMIRHSDNTATDLLHRAVGLQAVQNVADNLGLCHTRLILPTKAWWTSQVGLSPAFEREQLAWPALQGEARLRVAQAIDADATAQRSDLLQRRLDDYFDHHYDSARDLLVHNVSTPYEFSLLLAHEFLYPQLSDQSRQLQRKLMALGYGRSALRGVPVAEWGGKGGNGWKILTYTGYLKTVGGEHVVYAFMLHGSPQDYTMPLSLDAFAWIRAAMQDVLLPGDGGKQEKG